MVKPPVTIVSPGFNPSAPKYMCLWGQFHARNVAICMVFLEMLWVALNIAAIFLTMQDTLLKKPKLLIPLVIIMLLFTVVPLMCFLGLARFYKTLLYPQICLQATSALCCFLSAIYCFIFYTIGRMLLQDVGKVQAEHINQHIFLKVLLTLCGVTTIINLFRQLVKLSLFLGISLGLFCFFMAYALRVTLGALRFLKAYDKHRTRIHTNGLTPGQAPPPYYTPARPVQPELQDPMKDFYGGGFPMQTKNRRIESPDPRTLSEIPITPYSGTNGLKVTPDPPEKESRFFSHWRLMQRLSRKGPPEDSPPRRDVNNNVNRTGPGF